MSDPTSTHRHAPTVVAGRDPELAARLNEEKRLRCNAETMRSRPASADEGARQRPDTAALLVIATTALAYFAGLVGRHLERRP